MIINSIGCDYLFIQYVLHHHAPLASKLPESELDDQLKEHIFYSVLLKNVLRQHVGEKRLDGWAPMVVDRMVFLV